MISIREFSSSNSNLHFRSTRNQWEIKQISIRTKNSIEYSNYSKTFYHSNDETSKTSLDCETKFCQIKFTGYHITLISCYVEYKDRRVSDSLKSNLLVEKREARCPPGWNTKSKQHGPVCRENKRNIHGMLAPATCPLARESMQICVLLKCCCSVSRFVTRLPRPFLSLPPPSSLFSFFCFPFSRFLSSRLVRHARKESEEIKRD